MTHEKKVVDNSVWVVLRDNIRVSDLEHETPEAAIVELEHWETIVKTWPDGTKVKLHEKKKN